MSNLVNSRDLRDRLVEKLENFSVDQLKSLWQFVEFLEYQEKQLEIKTPKTKEESMALAERFKQLCQQSQAEHADNPLTEEEILSEIDAYRRGE